MVDSIRAIQYGLGPIGVGIARLVSKRSGIELVGGVDTDAAKVGRDLSELLGQQKSTGVKVRAHLAEVLAETDANVVLHSTGSSLKGIWTQLEDCVRAGLNVVSTCEELAYPAAQYPDLARDLDALAKAHGVTVLGTGINPGYAMDSLALFLSGVCESVDRVLIRRRLDASGRRLPLQKKIGAGLTIDEFKDLVLARKVRHVGLVESLTMLADGLGWTLERTEEITEPVIAGRLLKSAYLEVKQGDVAGVHQIGRAFVGGREALTLDLTMALGIEDPGDFVHLWGGNEVEMTVTGIRGDQATASMVVNCAPRVVHHEPGLLTMKDIALPTCWSRLA
jgi:2,4-diaminopentanoate dehydrogenase